jgi:hypothetical protein
MMGIYTASSDAREAQFGRVLRLGSLDGGIGADFLRIHADAKIEIVLGARTGQKCISEIPPYPQAGRCSSHKGDRFERKIDSRMRFLCFTFGIDRRLVREKGLVTLNDSLVVSRPSALVLYDEGRLTVDLLV